MRAMTCHVFGNGSMNLEHGIRLAWDSEKHRYVIPLGSRSDRRGIQIPVKGAVHRGKRSRRTTMRWSMLESYFAVYKSASR